MAEKPGYVNLSLYGWLDDLILCSFQHYFSHHGRYGNERLCAMALGFQLKRLQASPQSKSRPLNLQARANPISCWHSVTITS